MWPVHPDTQTHVGKSEVGKTSEERENTGYNDDFSMAWLKPCFHVKNYFKEFQNALVFYFNVKPRPK